MEPAATSDVAGRYERFARHEAAAHSAVFQAWAQGVADDPASAELIGRLPDRERQPNLVFAAARFVAPTLVDPVQAVARPDEYARFRAVLHGQFEAISRVTATHHTQTNEAGRIGVLLPALDAIHRACGKPLALLEFGASAGLVLHPEAWRYHYTARDGSERGMLSGARPVGDLRVLVSEQVVLPQSCPQVDWKLGIDLNPLDLRRPGTADWLRLLIWPGQTERLDRLNLAIAAAERDPVLVLARDLTGPEVLDEMLALVPPDCHPVIMHSAVLAYLAEPARQQFSDQMMAAVGQGRCSWVSMEGSSVVPAVAQALLADAHFRPDRRPGDFVVAVDGVPTYLVDGHARWIA